MLHSGKRESIIAWFNAMTMMKKDFSIQSLSELSDGKKFIVLISIVNNLKKGILPEDFESSNSQNESKDPDTDDYKQKSSELAKDEKIEIVSMAETDDEKTTEMEIEISNEICVETTTETRDEPGQDVDVEGNPNEINESEIVKRYEDIKKFINDFLAHDSSAIVVYTECPKGKEMELAKVAVFLLSAMVQSYLSVNMEHLYYTTVLNLQAQEDIKECLSLILTETDEPLKKVELQKILGRPSKSKSTPRRRTTSRSISEVLETPENSKSLSKKKQTKASMAEEIFESPLKNLWDSPKIQLKTQIFKKQVEINKLIDALHIEECKVIDLTIEKRSLNAELEKKKRELEFLKEDQRRALENADEVNAEKTIKLEEHLAEKQKDNKKIHELKEEIDILKKEIETLSSELAAFEKLSQKDCTEETNYKQQNIELIEKIKDLELNISLKDGKIKDLKERELSLKSDLKHYRQMLEEPNNRIAISPKAGLDRSGSIIYADARDVMKERDKLAKDLSVEQENARTWKKSSEKAEQALLKYKNDILKYKNELEKKDQELKYKNETLLVYKSWEESVLKNTKNRDDEEMTENTPLALLPCDNLESKSSTMESERDNDVKEEPETSTTSTIWDTHKAMGTRSRPGSRRTSASSFSCTNSELNVFRDKIATVTSRMVDVFDKSEIQLLNKLELQAKSCSSLKDVTQYFAIMGSLIDSLKSAQPLPAKRNSVRATTPRDASGMQNELVNIKLKMDELQKEYKLNLDLKTNELKLAEEKYKTLELKVQELNQNLEKSQQDVKDATNKLKMCNQNYQKVLSEQKHLLKVYMALDKEKKSSEESCKDCPILRKKLSNMKHERNEYEKDSLELKSHVKELESRAKNLERQLKVEINEKKKLEFQIQRETAFLSGSLSDKRAVIHKYFQQGLIESRKAKERKLEEAQRQQPPVVSLNAFILTNGSKEPCPENSMSSTFANRSIRSGFLQTDDEEDFLNHSSLAQIQRETRPESEDHSDRRLTEIRRRNTLCLPHLKSSYPLEIQNMTPTERKYFEFRRPQPVDDDIDPDLLNFSDESNDAPSYPVNKRKVADMEDTSSQPVKKQARVFPIKRVSKEKPTTPMRKLLYKGKSFKTPTSIRRLMGISRKNN